MRSCDEGERPCEAGFRSLRLRLAAVALAGTAVAQNMNIAIATGGTGGVYYPLGGGMANVLSKYVQACRRRRA